jgi:hypothetical protein
MYQGDVAFPDYSDPCPPRLAVVRFNAVVRFRDSFSSSVSFKFRRRKSITTHLSSIRRVTFTLYHHMIRNRSQDHDSWLGSSSLRSAVFSRNCLGFETAVCGLDSGLTQPIRILHTRAFTRIISIMQTQIETCFGLQSLALLACPGSLTGAKATKLLGDWSKGSSHGKDLKLRRR